MKKIRSGVFLLFLLIACDEDRNLPAVPTIEIRSVEFVERTVASEPDLLVLHIDFKDGDGDLGLGGTENEPPYHFANYFYDDNGKLLTARSRLDPRYSYLPPYQSPFDCINYTDPTQTIFFPAAVVDNTFNIVDTKVADGVTYYGVKDVIYMERNEDHFNIMIDFLLKEADGSYTEFDWKTISCNQSFDGRFPRLEDVNGTLEGTLKYTMTSIGFKNVFGARPIKLRVVIKDRALNQSNVALSDEFSLID